MSVEVEEMPRLAGRRFEKVCQIIERHGRNPARLIPILQAVQDEYRYLPQEVLNFVATALDVPPARVFGVATFYAHFALEPKGKYVVRLCDGTACHVKGSIPILDGVRKHLKLQGKQKTTEDMLFTVETVACLGACGLAPVLVVNDDVHGQMSPGAAVKIVEAVQTEDAKGK
jgi:NADH-quinone oxidoreductase subunit E